MTGEESLFHADCESAVVKKGLFASVAASFSAFKSRRVSPASGRFRFVNSERYEVNVMTASDNAPFEPKLNTRIAVCCIWQCQWALSGYALDSVVRRV